MGHINLASRVSKRQTQSDHQALEIPENLRRLLRNIGTRSKQKLR